MLRKLKERWQVDSNLQLFTIFFVFSVSGSSTLFVRKFVFHLIHFDPKWPFIFKVLVYLVTIVPIYQLSLLIIGTILGQFYFFWRFEKKMLRRFGIKLK
ncbi:DUF6787 family protein [Mangrovibacterium lignilyticum]|uniref:DUF6787 family protein n=1 Tax=Mangrovibacterium lignilyticum TaxID=2668052 RepID=UPI003743F148